MWHTTRGSGDDVHRLVSSMALHRDIPLVPKQVTLKGVAKQAGRSKGGNELRRWISRPQLELDDLSGRWNAKKKRKHQRLIYDGPFN